MTFKINFSTKRTKIKPANKNIHHQQYWRFAHDIISESTPVNQWPRDFAVHYVYELMNRPWISEEQCLKDVWCWLTTYAPDLKLGALRR